MQTEVPFGFPNFWIQGHQDSGTSVSFKATTV
jgi:hypothetical protein